MNIKKKYTHKIVSVNLKNKQSRKKNNYQFRESNPLELKLTNIPQQNILIGGTPSQGDINFPAKLNIPKKSINFDTQGISETNESLTNLLAGEKKKLVGKYQMIVVSKNRGGSFEIFSVKPSKKLEVEQEGGMPIFRKERHKTQQDIEREKELKVIKKITKNKEPSSFFGKKSTPPTPAEEVREQAVNLLGGIAAASKPEPNKGKSLVGKDKKKTSFLSRIHNRTSEAAQKDKKKESKKSKKALERANEDKNKTSFLDSLKEKALETGKKALKAGEKGMKFADEAKKTAEEMAKKADEVASDPKVIEQIRAATSAASTAASIVPNVASAAASTVANVAISAANAATTATADPATSATTSPSEPTTSSAITTANTTKSSSSDNSTSDDSLIDNEYIFDIFEIESKGDFIKISFRRLDKKINHEPEKSFLYIKKIEDYFQIFGGDLMVYLGDFLHYPHRLIITKGNGQHGGMIKAARNAAAELNPALAAKAEAAAKQATDKISQVREEFAKAAKSTPGMLNTITPGLGDSAASMAGNIAEAAQKISKGDSSGAMDSVKAVGEEALKTAGNFASSAVQNATEVADSAGEQVQQAVEATKSEPKDSTTLDLPLSEQELQNRREKMTEGSEKTLTELKENKGELPDEGDVGEGNDEGEQGDERVEGEEDEEGEEVEESEEEGEEGEKGSKQGKKKGSKNGEGQDGESGEGDGDLEARVSKLENMLNGLKSQLAIEPKDSEKCVNVTIPDCDGDDNDIEQENEDAHIKHKNMVQLSKILRVMEPNEDRSSLYTFIKGNDNMYEWVPIGQADSNLCNLGLLFQRLMILSALPLNNKEKTLFSSICKNLNNLEDDISGRNKLAITLEALDIED